MRTGVLVLAALLSSACAPGRPGRAPSDRKALLNVPFFPDDTDQCGPSALASVLNYWGKPVAPADLRKEIYRARLRGSLTVDLLLAAEDRGLAAEIVHASLERVKRELDEGRPVIAFVNRGFRFYPLGHYLVLTGYDDGRGVFLAHSGSKRDRVLSYQAFDRRWEKTDRWALFTRAPRP